MDIVGLWDRIDSHLVGSRYKHIKIIRKDGSSLTRFERAMRLSVRNFPILLCFGYFAYLLGETISTYDEAHLLEDQYRLYLLRSVTLVSVAVPVFLSIIFQTLWQLQVLLHPQKRGIWDLIYDTYVVHDHESRAALGPKRTKAKALFAPVIRFCAVMGVLFVLVLTVWVSVTSYDPPLADGYDKVLGEEVPNIAAVENGLYHIKHLSAPATADEGKLPFPAIARPISCYVTQVKLVQMPHTCASRLEIVQRIKDHNILLARYQGLYQTPIFVENSETKLTQQEERLLLGVHQLQLAYWGMRVQNGDAETVLQEWLRDMNYWYQAMQGDLSLHMRSLIATPYYRGLKFLPVILEARTSLIKKYEAEIMAILQQPLLGDVIWDLKKNWSVSVTQLYDDGLLDVPFNFYLKPHHTRNMIYQMAQDYIGLAQAPASQYWELSAAYKQKYRRSYHRGFFKRLFYNPIGHMMAYGSYQSPEPILTAHRYVAYQRQLQIYMMAKLQNIADKDMASFIENQPLELQNPLTNMPFSWDKDERVLYFNASDHPYFAHLRAMRLYF